jgi:hypothetical protein
MLSFKRDELLTILPALCVLGARHGKKPTRSRKSSD